MADQSRVYQIPTDQYVQPPGLPANIQPGPHPTVVTVQPQIPTFTITDRGFDNDRYKVGLCDFCL